MEKYNMPPLGLFGKRCRIKNVSNMKEGFVYRIVTDGIRSNYWADIPLGRFDSKPTRHNTIEDIVIVICDTLIDDQSKLERVRLKDIEIMNEQEPILDKIRAEIKTKYDGIPWRNNDYDDGWIEALEWVFDDVIGKYKAESEE